MADTLAQRLAKLEAQIAAAMVKGPSNQLENKIIDAMVLMRIMNRRCDDTNQATVLWIQLAKKHGLVVDPDHVAKFLGEVEAVLEDVAAIDNSDAVPAMATVEATSEAE